MDPIKEAFSKIKEDISLLQSEISSLKQEISLIKSLNSNNLVNSNPTKEGYLPTSFLSPTDIPAHTPAVPQEIRGLGVSKNDISIGNKGVPTDNPTYRPANQQTVNNPSFSSNLVVKDPLDKLQETLESLDNIRRELRIKFKQLTSQEMLVFTTLYSLENEGITDITYRVLATHLNLTESSIRDYIIKLLSKGIPIKKQRLNNKKIVLSVSEDLKKMASISTIIKLREL